MNPFIALFITELKFQWRHGFVAAAIIITVVWAGLISLLPMSLRSFWFGIVAGIDVAAIGLLFGYGLGALDKSQQIMIAIRLTAVRSYFLGLARLAALSLLPTITLMVLAFLVLTPIKALQATPGIILCSVFFSSVGITAARRFKSINQFIIFFALSGALWAIPILYFADIVQSSIWLLLPSGGAMALLRLAFEPLPGLIILTAIVAQLLWIGVCFLLGEHWASTNFEHRFGGH